MYKLPQVTVFPGKVSDHKLTSNDLMECKPLSLNLYDSMLFHTLTTDTTIYLFNIISKWITLIPFCTKIMNMLMKTLQLFATKMSTTFDSSTILNKKIVQFQQLYTSNSFKKNGSVEYIQSNKIIR